MAAVDVGCTSSLSDQSPKRFHVSFSGSYCLASTTASPRLRPTPCPPGRYGNAQGLVEETECELCDEGKFCETEGQTRSEISSSPAIMFSLQTPLSVTRKLPGDLHNLLRNNKSVFTD